MENPRPEKVAVVDEVREKFERADAVLFTEYRGLKVRELAELRATLRAAGGEYRVYKNTLVRRATKDLDIEADLADDLTGPTALAFVGQKPDGTPGDAVVVAKALQAFAKSNPLLVVKGGLLGTHVLDADSAKALANVAPREELLARLAGGMAAPMREFAALLQAVPASFAYGLAALIDAGGAAGAPTDAAPADAETTDEAPASAEEEETPAAAADETPADADGAADAASDDTPADDAAAEQE
ncbi:MAG: 50S ribosomal protein L10 [Microthrixaceae bacterium]